MTGDSQHQYLPSPPTSELRHITSNPALLSASHPRQPHQQLSTLSPNSSKAGSRSPASIPSSPTSIHSSSSAIFERDIEALPCASAQLLSISHNPPNPHRTPRAKATEQLEQAVPSVLAEAASALAVSSDDDISVIAPVPAPTPISLAGSVGSRSPPLRSRSPSPSPPSRKTSLPTSASTSPVTGRQSKAARRTSTGPLAPGGFSTPSRSPVPSPTTAVTALPSPPSDSLHATSAHQKRLSFVSYSDLLASTPITALPLSSFTTPPTSMPPPHLPAVSAATAVSPAASQGAPSRPLSTYSISTSGRGGGFGEEQGVGKRLKDDIGGEWEREGFGKGLEERLEELMVGKA